MEQNTGRQNGFTLIELIITMGLTVLLLTCLFTLLSTSLKSWAVGSSRTELQQTARYAIDTLTRDLQFATDIQIPDTKGLEIRTSKYGTANQKINYSVDSTGSTKTLRKNSNDGSGWQPVTGGGNTPVSVDISFSNLTPTSGSIKTVGIELTATDQNQDYKMTTAITGIYIQ